MFAKCCMRFECFHVFIWQLVFQYILFIKMFVKGFCAAQSSPCISAPEVLEDGDNAMDLDLDSSSFLDGNSFYCEIFNQTN